MKYSLLSTVVAPSFLNQTIRVWELTKDEFLEKLKSVSINFCGHPVTNAVLREHVPTLPFTIRGAFWNGEGHALAARPKGGDTQVTIDKLEFVEFFIS